MNPHPLMEPYDDSGNQAANELLTEVERLRSWKREALEVIRAWERVHEALGRPGALGESKAAASLREVERLLTRGRCGR